MPNNKILTALASVVLLAGAVYLGILSWNAAKAHNYIGVSAEQRHSIMINGEGKVTGAPDVALVQLGYEAEKKTVAEAQKENTEKMNSIIDKLKNKFAIEAKDIKTINYNIYPNYDWVDGKQNLRGYKVSQTISVKVRAMDKVNQILDEAGKTGLNQIGGLSFEIDDPEALRQEARELALKQAKEKAESLAKIAGVNLGRIISFSESSAGEPSYYDYKSSYAMGGGGETAAPAVEAGSTEISVIAAVEYEIN